MHCTVGPGLPGRMNPPCPRGDRRRSLCRCRTPPRPPRSWQTHQAVGPGRRAVGWRVSSKAARVGCDPRRKKRNGSGAGPLCRTRRMAAPGTPWPLLLKWTGPRRAPVRPGGPAGKLFSWPAHGPGLPRAEPRERGFPGRFLVAAHPPAVGRRTPRTRGTGRTSSVSKTSSSGLVTLRGGTAGAGLGAATRGGARRFAEQGPAQVD